MGQLLNLVGTRFGRLIVTAYLGGSRWSCVCDCGSETVTGTGHLRSGNTTSCGCRKRSVLGESTTKHGKAGTRTYRIWKAMRSRCNNPNHPRYKDYGGRGIKVCERWSVFENFLADMGECPDGRSINRIDNDGDYEPGNCHWASSAEQSTNRRVTIAVEGVPLSVLARERGVSYHTLYDRYRRGVPI